MTIFITVFLSLLAFFGTLHQSSAPHGATAIIDVSPVTSGDIERYAKFEVGFRVAGSSYTNPYFPYDETPIPGLTPGTGISVDAFFLPPHETNWAAARRTGCFYFQPYDEATLVPQGPAQWRCRYTPEAAGNWQYRIRVIDRNGATESPIYEFTCTESPRKGFVRVSKTDPRFFEFSDGTPFVSTLVTVNPLRSRTDIETTIAKLGRHGIRFVRWFPNSEDGTVNLFGDSIRSSWRFGASGSSADDPDSARGKTWSYSPYYYSGQTIFLQRGQKYRLSLRANVTGEQVLKVALANLPAIVICSASNPLHGGCTARNTGWNGYEMTFTADATGNVELYLHGLYVSTDAPSPYHEVRSGKIRISEVILQRDESGTGDWGGNMVSRGDSDTHLYVDQNQAAIMDQILSYSEKYAVYHKLTIFHKNDGILNHYDQHGNLAGAYQCEWGSCPVHFYSGEGEMVRWLQKAYMRYFLARWSYSPAIHSLEYVNESDLYQDALQAGWMYAEYIAENSSRKILTTNSFWGYWADTFFKDPAYGQYLDYADVHWYANREVRDDDPISTLWDDTVANVRQCYLRFKQYAAQGAGYSKPFVRGETGVALAGTGPQDPALAAETTGTYYHKKLWAHVGLLGYTCDGEWYPRLFEAPSANAFPNSTVDLYKIYAAYDKFIAGEPLNNGTHVDLGIDLSGDSAVTSTNPQLRVYGSKDPATARVLVWVDNRSNTWLNPHNAATAEGTVFIPGMPPGRYSQETWDTRAGTYTKAANAVTVAADGILRFSVGTSRDVAFKFYLGKTAPSVASLYLPHIQN